MKKGDPVREHYTAIGIVAAEWAEFEWLIDQYCCELAGVRPDIGACFTAQISGAGRKLSAYISLAQLKGVSKVLGDLRVFVSGTVGLAEQRNRIVHDPWVTPGDGFGGIRSQRLEVTARHRLRREFVEVSTADLFRCAEHIRQHRLRLEQLHERLFMELSSSGADQK